MSIRDTLLSVIKEATGAPAPELSVPEHDAFGHFATNVALIQAKVGKKDPKALAEEYRVAILEKAPEGFLERVEVAGPGFLNFWIHKDAIRGEARALLHSAKTQTRLSVGKGKRVIVEYSQPNIAKRLHTGHLRTTIIGDALANIHEALGYEVIRWNYLGDWGTQFGKLIVAYRMWGDKAKIEANPVEELEALYVKFHAEAEKDPTLEEKGRAEFKKLEAGDAENRKLWEWFKEASLREANEMYERLGIRFDTYIGEAFFEPYLVPLIDELVAKGIAKESEGALIVPLDEEGLPPALVRKSDGASLYLTRDIAALRYRIEKYNPAKLLYVVGNEQALHFDQLLAVARRLGITKNCEVRHVKYGLMLGEGGKKMSTREGTSVPLKELIAGIVERAGKVVQEKNPKLSEAKKRGIAEMVGVGALKYNDLKENRMSDIVFDWKKMLDFAGDSAPYLQYTHARLKSILRKAPFGARFGFGPVTFANLEDELECTLMRKWFALREELERSGEALFTSNMAKYLHELSTLANRFYETTPILKDANRARRRERLALIEGTALVLKEGLALLGIRAPEKV